MLDQCNAGARRATAALDGLAELLDAALSLGAREHTVSTSDLSTVLAGSTH